MQTALTYQDIYLIPRYSELNSRSDADLTTEFLGRKFKLPVIPANMSSVINEDIAYWLSQNDYPYIYHRFGDTRKFLQRTRAEAWKLVSISVGVKESDKELIRDIAESKCRVDWITIDIAHGHSLQMREMIEFIRRTLPDVKIIAGNVATSFGVDDLQNWGADAVKCGVGPGGACSTKNMTGFHVPMFTCAQDCAERFMDADSFEELPNIPIILDGGIRENGDIAKALVAAHGTPALVMCGSLLAACIDAPGENIYETKKEWTNITLPGENGHFHSETGIYQWKDRKTDKVVKKCYHGSASAKQKGEKKHVEGFELEIACNGMTFCEKYKELTESLQSAVSYAGGKDLSVFNQTKYIIKK